MLRCTNERSMERKMPLKGASFAALSFDSCVYLGVQSEQTTQQMASRPVFEPSGAAVG